MNVKQHFSTRLKELREEKGLNQGQLANELKISRGSVSFYENGERTPDIEIFDRICSFFNVSYDYMFGKSDIKKQNTTISAIREYTGLSDKSILKLHTISTPDSIKKQQENVSDDVFSCFILCDQYCSKAISKIIEDKEFAHFISSVSRSAFSKSFADKAKEALEHSSSLNILSASTEEEKKQIVETLEKALEIDIQCEDSYNGSRYILNKHFEKLMDNVIDELEVEYHGNNSEEE